MNGGTLGGVSPRAGAPAKLESGSQNTWVEGWRPGWVGHLHPGRLVGDMAGRGESGRNLLSPGPWRDRAEWKRSYKWEPLGLP